MKRPPILAGCRSVDQYEKLNKIDEGTYGVVYRARDRDTKRIVALKRLKIEKEKVRPTELTNARTITRDGQERAPTRDGLRVQAQLGTCKPIRTRWPLSVTPVRHPFPSCLPLAPCPRSHPMPPVFSLALPVAFVRSHTQTGGLSDHVAARDPHADDGEPPQHCQRARDCRGRQHQPDLYRHGVCRARPQGAHGGHARAVPPIGNQDHHAAAGAHHRVPCP